MQIKTEILAEIRERLTAIETSQGELKRFLGGNGQPGEIRMLHSRITETREKLESRITDVENRQSEQRGFVTAITAVGGLMIMVGEWLIHRFYR